MRDLTSVPVFGWETSQCNANKGLESKIIENYENIFPKLFEKPLFRSLSDKNKQKIIHGGKALLSKGKGRSHYVRNILKVAGYLPVVGQIVGIAKLIFLAVTFNSSDSKKYLHIGRAAVEAFGFGLYLLPVDLIATLVRSDKKNPPVEIKVEF